MRQILRNRPSPSMVVALIALAVALGGTGYAAVSLPKNSVGTKQLKRSAVTGAKVKASAITGAKVKNDSLTQSDVLESSLAKVPSAASADNATSSTNATNAANANTLGGIGSSGFAQVKTRVFEAASVLSIADYANDATLFQLTDLPGGQYVIQAKLQVDNDTVATDELIDCDLLAAGVQLDTQDQRLGGANDVGDELGYTLIGAFTASAAGTDDVLVRCQQTGADNDVDNTHIIATLINN
jgi:hypothetical protein